MKRRQLILITASIALAGGAVAQDIPPVDDYYFIWRIARTPDRRSAQFDISIIKNSTPASLSIRRCSSEPIIHRWNTWMTEGSLDLSSSEARDLAEVLSNAKKTYADLKPKTKNDVTVGRFTITFDKTRYSIPQPPDVRISSEEPRAYLALDHIDCAADLVPYLSKASELIDQVESSWPKMFSLPENSATAQLSKTNPRILNEIRARAWKLWPEDYSKRSDSIESQCHAYEEWLRITQIDGIDLEQLASAKSKAQRGAEGDYVKQVELFKKEAAPNGRKD